MTVLSDDLASTGQDRSVTFGYNPAGQIASATRTGDAYAWEGHVAVNRAELDGYANILRRYVHGPGTDEPLVWYEGAGLSTRRWFHADERGSVVAVSDSNGAAIGINAYDEYGIPRSGGLRTVYGRFGYTGQMWLPEIGMYHYRARAYSPSLGRFLQTDPIGFGGGMNIYAYVLNDPVNLADPSGLCENGINIYWNHIEANYNQNGGLEVDRNRTFSVPIGQACFDAAGFSFNFDAQDGLSEASVPNPELANLQRSACGYIPEVRDPVVRAALLAVRRAGLTYVDSYGQRRGVEFAAWIEPTASGLSAGPLFTDGRSNFVDVGSRMSWRTWWYGGAIVVHNHNSPGLSQLSDADLGVADSFNVLVIAIARDGRLYCHDAR